MRSGGTPLHPATHLRALMVNFISRADQELLVKYCSVIEICGDPFGFALGLFPPHGGMCPAGLDCTTLFAF
jgi:hypothetical protein